MGMFDDVKVEYPLPDSDGLDDNNFQTKSFGDGFVGGFMNKYTITKEGALILHKEAWESVPEKERPYYGKPEWEQNPMFKMAGCMKAVPLGDEVMDCNGTVNIYTSIGNTVSGTWYEYDFKFTDGKVLDVKRVNKELLGG